MKLRSIHYCIRPDGAAAALCTGAGMLRQDCWHQRNGQRATNRLYVQAAAEVALRGMYQLFVILE
jgi:hypothetical protein